MTLPNVPEMPPGYCVGQCDEGGGWLVGDTEAWFDDDVYGEPQDTREDAVSLAWDHWANYVASEEWREFIALHMERDSGRAIAAEQAAERREAKS